jgi:hypothetical protein
LNLDRPRGYHQPMTGRFRSLAALLALFGFTVLFTESLVAMSCTPADAGAVVSLETEIGHDGMHHPAPVPAHPESETPEHCPLTMAGGSSCVLPPTLPLAVTSVYVAPPALDPAVIAVDGAAHELFIRPLFHPPRA